MTRPAPTAKVPSGTGARAASRRPRSMRAIRGEELTSSPGGSLVSIGGAILRRARDPAAGRLFGEEPGDEISKFDRCSWRPGPGDTPVIDGCDWFVGGVLDRVEVGDHVLYLLEVAAEGDAARAPQPQLGFQAV